MKNRMAFLAGIILCFASYSSLAQKPFIEVNDPLLYEFTPNDLVVKTIELSTGIQMEYAEQGSPDGVPVIFLHGFPDSWRSYESTMANLPVSFHAFALSQRGHGNTSKPQGNYHPKDMAADVAAFVKKKKLGKVIITGHSMGSVITQQFALDYPELVRGIVLIGADASFRNNPGMPEFIGEVNKMTDPIDYAFAEAFQKSTIVKPIDSLTVKMYVEESMKLPARVWKSVVNGFMSVDFTNELHKIQQPVLLVWGDKDNIALKSDQDILLKGLKNARIVVYKGNGHSVQWEEPARFAGDFIQFADSLQ